MQFDELLVDREHFFSVGVERGTREPIICVTVTGVGWTDLYFRLTAEEFSAARADVHVLDDLASRLAQDKGAKVLRGPSGPLGSSCR